MLRISTLLPEYVTTQPFRVYVFVADRLPAAKHASRKTDDPLSPPLACRQMGYTPHWNLFPKRRALSRQELGCGVSRYSDFTSS